MGLGLESQLGPRFARHKDPARRLLADIERVDREAAQPNLVLARAEAPADQQPASPPRNAAQPFVQTAQAQAGTAPVTLPEIGTDDQQIGSLLRKALPLLAAGAIVPTLAAAMVLLTTGPAGGETEELQKTLNDGRDVRFRFNRDERAGELTVTGPSGDEVRFTLLQTADNGLVFTDGAVSADGGQERILNRRELAAVIDAVAPAFAEAGVRIEIGGDEDDGEYYGTYPPTTDGRGFTPVASKSTSW